MISKLTKQGFAFKEGIIAGEECWLIGPQQQDTIWTEDNLGFRSVIVRKSDFKVLSRGFSKFFNWHEQPELAPIPTNEPVEILTKMDGSLLIVSSYNGELIHRTRGTFNAENLANGHEIELLKKKYPKAFLPAEKYSYLFEWVSPDNVIVVRATEPDIHLLGIIDNETGELMPQYHVDSYSQIVGVSRPKLHLFASNEKMLDEVAQWVGVEGVCVYFNGGQSIKKVKGEWYLRLHRLKSRLGNIKAVIELFVESDCPAHNEFYDLVGMTLDYEIAEFAKKDIMKVCDDWAAIKFELSQIKEFVEPLKELDRKDAAKIILDKYAKNSGIAFTLLNGAPLTNQNKVKLLCR